MVIQLMPEECVAALRREGGALVHAASQDLGRQVPYYPEWRVADLVAHTGAIHRWVLGIVRSRATERPAREPYEDRDPERLLAWFEEGLAVLASELGTVRRPGGDRMSPRGHRNPREPGHPRRPSHERHCGRRARRVRRAPLRRCLGRVAREVASRRGPGRGGRGVGYRQRCRDLVRCVALRYGPPCSGHPRPR